MEPGGSGPCPDSNRPQRTPVAKARAEPTAQTILASVRAHPTQPLCKRLGPAARPRLCRRNGSDRGAVPPTSPRPAWCGLDHA